jgi:hypothetical protein
VRHWSTASIVVTALVVSACASTVSGTPVRPRGMGQTDALTAMLLGLDEVRDITEADDLQISETYEKFLDYVEFTPERCAGVPFNTIERAYRNSGYQGVSGMVMANDGQKRWVDEAVVRFATPGAAHRFVTDNDRIWRDCVGVAAHAVPGEDNDVQIWAIGETVRLPDSTGLMVTTSRVDKPGKGCTHAMADRGDLVIDVVVCGPGPTNTDQAVTLLNRIADKPPV